MAHNVSSAKSPTAKAMDRAIDMAIEGNSPYPEHAAFVDADSPHAGQEIALALEEGFAVVLVSADGRERVVTANAVPPDLSREGSGAIVGADRAIGTAVIGYGYWGPNLARNIAESPELRLEALCDLDVTQLSLFRRRHPDARAVGELDVVLGDPSIEAVVIATPPVTHHPLAKRALEAGKHVLVEKPLARSVEDARELARIATANGRVLMPGHTFIYSPAVNAVRDLIRKGVIGDVHFITSSRMNLGKYSSEGVLWDLAPNDLSILLYWLEQPVVEVAAFGSSVLRQGVPETAFMTLTFERGQTANVQISWLAPRKVRQMIVVGSQRMVQYDDTASDEPVRIYDRGMDMLPPTPTNFGEHQLIYRTGDVVTPRIEPREPLRLELEDFAHSIRTGEEPRSSLAIGIEIVAVVEQAEASLREGGAARTMAGFESASARTTAA
jgi:predicted dehydrogenase